MEIIYIVGAYNNDDDGENSGSAYIFVRDGTSWSQQAKLTASDAYVGDNFGISVAIYGNHAVVGSYLDDDGGTSSGSAYIFTRSGTSWSQQKKIVASDYQSNDYFARSVAMNGGYIICGADGEDQRGSSAGAAYIFIRNKLRYQLLETNQDGILILILM